MSISSHLIRFDLEFSNIPFENDLNVKFCVLKKFDSIDFKKYDPEFYEKLKESTSISNLNSILTPNELNESPTIHHHAKKDSYSSIFSDTETERPSAFKPVRRSKLVSSESTEV